MTKKRIGIDVDEVLSDTMHGFVAFHNGRYGTQLHRDSFFSYAFEDVIGISPQEGIKRVREFYDSIHFMELAPKSGATGAVRLLAQEHELVVITARHDVVMQATERWLQEHFPGAFSEVYYSHSHDGTNVRKSKAEFCSELGVHVFIEDNLDYATAALAPGRRVLLFDSPWNRADPHPELERVHSWDEIIDKVKGKR